MAKNAYGQESDLEDFAQWVSRSNTHLDSPSQGDESTTLPKQSKRSGDEESVSELEKGG